MSFGELILTLLFFPLWGVLGGLLLMAAQPVISAVITPKYQDRFYFVILIGVALPASLLVLTYLNCWLLIDLPYMEPSCRFLGF